MTESMGTIYTRFREHLGTTDTMIIRTRRRLLHAAKAYRETGIPSPGVDHPEVYHQRSGDLVLPRSLDWWDGTKERRERFDYVPAEEATKTTWARGTGEPKHFETPPR